MMISHSSYAAAGGSRRSAWRRWWWLGGLFFCLPGPWEISPQPAALFTDVVDRSGVAFKHAASKTSQKYLIETMGSGVAVLDYDNDGWLDLFFVNGAHIEDPMPEGKQPSKADPKYWNRLYRNNGDWSFSDVTQRAGLAGSGYGMGAAVGDFDNDGFEDLYVTNYGWDILYRNNRDGTFSDVTIKAGVRTGGWSASAGFFDYDRDGHLDLYVTRYLEASFADNRYCSESGRRAYCHPKYFQGAPDKLYRNNGNGTFADVSEAAGIANPKGKGLGVSFADFDRDGFPDVYVANDSVASFLYRNNRDGTFSELGLVAGVSYNSDGKSFAGMGTDFDDYNDDGWPDVFVTTLSYEMFTLFKNNGDGSFSDVRHSSGVGAATARMAGWGTHFFDHDNDGDKDIFVANGHVDDTIDYNTSPGKGGITYLQPPVLLAQQQGQFVDLSSSLGEPFRRKLAGRGAAFGDLDNDGDIDVVVSNCDQRPSLLRNDRSNAHHWIRFELVGTRSNRDGLGAEVTLHGPPGRVQYGRANTAYSYCSAGDKKVAFGLGTSGAAANVAIRWPSGIIQRLENVKSDQLVRIRESRD